MNYIKKFGIMALLMGWYVIYTKSQNEYQVAKRLSDVGISVLNPEIIIRRYTGGKISEKIEPLFPCYILANFDPEKFLHLIKYTRGVRYVLFRENPVEVHPLIVNSIINRMDEKGFVRIEPKAISPGERVVIKSGPFKDFYAIFERELNKRERVSLLLEALNARIVIDACMLDRA